MEIMGCAVKPIHAAWLYEAHTAVYEANGYVFSLDDLDYETGLVPAHKALLETLEAIITRETGDIPTRIIWDQKKPFTTPSVKGYETRPLVALPMHWCSMDGLVASRQATCPYCYKGMTYLGDRYV